MLAYVLALHLVAPNLRLTPPNLEAPKPARLRLVDLNDCPDFERPEHKADVRSAEFWSAMGGVASGHLIAFAVALGVALVALPLDINNHNDEFPPSVGIAILGFLLADFIAVPLCAALFASWDAPPDAHNLGAAGFGATLVHLLACGVIALGALTGNGIAALVALVGFAALEFVGLPMAVVSGLNAPASELPQPSPAATARLQAPPPSVAPARTFALSVRF